MTQRKNPKARARTPVAVNHDDHTLAIAVRAVAAFAVSAFATSDAAVTAALEVLRTVGDSQTSFLARYVASRTFAIMRVVSAEEPGTTQIAVEMLLQEQGTAFRARFTAKDSGRMVIGTRSTGEAYLVVPLIAPDGQLWGMLGGIGVTPTTATRGELAETLAQLLLAWLIRDDTQEQRVTTHASALTVEAPTQSAEFETILMAVSDALFIHDHEGHLMRLNPAARELLGVTNTTDPAIAGEMGERAARWDLRDASGHTMPAPDWPLARVLRGEQLAGESAVDVRMHSADGHERIISFSGAPIRAEDGTIIGAITLAHDVTTRRRLEQRTHTALDAMLGMATALAGPSRTATDEHDVQRVVALTQHVLAGRSTSIVRVNLATGLVTPEAVVGLTPEIERRWWQDLHDAQATAYLPSEDIAQLAAGEALQFDLAAAPPIPGQDYFGAQLILVIAAPLVDGDLCILTVEARDRSGLSAADIGLARAAVHLVTLVMERDRLLRERAEAQARELTLQATNTQMLAFLGIAGHELRTPVTSIKASIQLAARAVSGVLTHEPLPQAMLPLSRAQIVLATADRQITKLNSLIEDLLDVTRIQAGKLELRLTRADLTAVVETALADQQLVWSERSLTLSAPDAPIWLRCDADRVAQVVTNFLTNALKYSAEDQPVHVVITQGSHQARVAVTDQGPGIAADAQAHLWELFHQVPGIHQLSGGGIGLGIGLYLCRTIIERHGGRVGVTSEPGHGATFWFELPLMAEAAL